MDSGLLPYTIERSQFTAAQITTITNSMRKIEQQTGNCIRFVERINHLTWIRISVGTGGRENNFNRYSTTEVDTLQKAYDFSMIDC
ncbi:unnamed protein product [Rotaria socialis]|uniref:Uncharacterized protein n=3 Tax=Rotaria socialis TaxID=392032 RepID=A0A820R6H4_9BILA|nr:unnamed protein product [Rotaria socialis]CAF4531269.1 unnamed protein product [Rotaria socialis]